MSTKTEPPRDEVLPTGIPRTLTQLFKRERVFLAVLLCGFLAVAATYQTPHIAMWVGFAFAGYSAVANDSIQTIGTFLASNKDKPWWMLWAFIGGIFLVTVTWGWVAHDGDVSYGRLASKGFEVAPTEFSYLQVAAPLILMILTRLRMPVSTTFLLLSSFAASGKSLWSVTTKSVSGYVIAFVCAIILWMLVSKAMDKWMKAGPAKPIWRIAQWIAAGLLWAFWLQQDMANIAVYLPRSLSLWQFVGFAGAIFLGLGLLFRQGGDRIQDVVDEKSGVVDVRAATVINLLYAVILLVFKVWSQVPMSTTWVFIGLLAGRELAMSWRKVGNNDMKGSIKMMAKDLRNVVAGFLISLILAAAINPVVRESLMSFGKE